MNVDILSFGQITYHLYTKLFESLLDTYGMTQMEIDIILFLANHPEYDSAAQLVSVRHLTKSHVSTAIANLVKHGYIERFYLEDNKKTIHLRLLKKADVLVQEGRKVQNYFRKLIFHDFDEKELQTLMQLMNRVQKNTKEAYAACLKGEL